MNKVCLGLGHTAPTGLLGLLPGFAAFQFANPAAELGQRSKGFTQHEPVRLSTLDLKELEPTPASLSDFLYPALELVGVRGIPAVPAITDQGTGQKAHPIPQTQPEPHGIVTGKAQVLVKSPLVDERLPAGQDGRRAYPVAVEQQNPKILRPIPHRVVGCVLNPVGKRAWRRLIHQRFHPGMDKADGFVRAQQVDLAFQIVGQHHVVLMKETHQLSAGEFQTAVPIGRDAQPLRVAVDLYARVGERLDDIERGVG